ncbi:MAG: hypothetical protein U0559_01705 [Anaerolineae bacterium]
MEPEWFLEYAIDPGRLIDLLPVTIDGPSMRHRNCMCGTMRMVIVNPLATRTPSTSAARTIKRIL